MARLQTRFEVDRDAGAARGARGAAGAMRCWRPTRREEMTKRLGLGLRPARSGLCHLAQRLSQARRLPGRARRSGRLLRPRTSERIAPLILGQRGNLKKIAAMLDDPARTAKVLALRLAVILCHARREVQLPRWSLRAGERAIELRSRRRRGCRATR
ncbi:MAG: hypothetical protein MZW92_04365 [Comamonadaceae bacterium]|nr:hypothetical protein [Comamonadaceae bacterium]